MTILLTIVTRGASVPSHGTMTDKASPPLPADPSMLTRVVGTLRLGPSTPVYDAVHLLLQHQTYQIDSFPSHCDVMNAPHVADIDDVRRDNVSIISSRNTSEVHRRGCTEMVLVGGAQCKVLSIQFIQCDSAVCVVESDTYVVRLTVVDR